MANPSDPGFRMTTHSPEELERFAALFIPTWELPAEVATGPDPGFKAAPMDVATVTALTEPKPAAPKPVKSTMMAMAAPVPMPSVIVEPPPAVVVAPAAPIAPPPAFRPQPVSLDDDLSVAAPKKKSPMLFVALGAAVVALGVGGFIMTRSSDEKPKADTTEKAVDKTTEKKAMDLPEPTVAPVEAKTAEPTPAPKETAAAKETATAKAPEPPPPPKAAVAPPPPPKATAAPPPPAPKATTAPAPKATTAPAKKPKIKDEF